MWNKIIRNIAQLLMKNYDFKSLIINAIDKQTSEIILLGYLDRALSDKYHGYYNQPYLSNLKKAIKELTTLRLDLLAQTKVDDLATKYNTYINSEEFIDKIIKRIKDKQI